MAKRRMFAKTIIDSDSFLDMSLSTQALYFHLSMRADDEGFINNPRKISRMIGSNEDELKVLVAKKFILIFDSGVIVIKHWKIHNLIRADRICETVYLDERDQVVTNENESYSMLQEGCSQMSTTCQPNVRIGKDSIGKDSIGEVSRGKDRLVETNEAFEQFWKTYPKKKSKQIAKKAFEKHFKSIPPLDYLISHLEMMKLTKDWKKENGQYIPYPATWLNAHGWNDEVNLSDAEKAKAIIDNSDMSYKDILKAKGY